MYLWDNGTEIYPMFEKHFFLTKHQEHTGRSDQSNTSNCSSHDWLTDSV